jgi:hypothetical protein
MDHDEFFNSMNNQADELWDAIDSSAGSIVNKFGAQTIVDYAKTREDWKEWLESEEIDEDEGVEHIAYLFVADLIYANFTGTDLTS